MISQLQCVLITYNRINGMFELGLLARACNPSIWKNREFKLAQLSTEFEATPGSTSLQLKQLDNNKKHVSGELYCTANIFQCIVIF